MDIKLEHVEDLLWQDGIEFELLSFGEDISLCILGLRELVYVKPVWPDEEGELIFDSDDIYVYSGNELFGQIVTDTGEGLVEELNKILENYR